MSVQDLTRGIAQRAAQQGGGAGAIQPKDAVAAARAGMPYLTTLCANSKLLHPLAAFAWTDFHLLHCCIVQHYQAADNRHTIRCCTP